MSEINDEHLLNGDEDDTDYDLDEKEEALLLDEEYDNHIQSEELSEADVNKSKREGKFTTERKVITAPTTKCVSTTIPDTLDQVNVDITQISTFKQKRNRRPFARGRHNGFNRHDFQQKNRRDRRDFNFNRTVHINPHFAGVNSPWEHQQVPNQFPNNQVIHPWASNAFNQITPTISSNFPALNQQQCPPYNNYSSVPFVDSSVPPVIHMDRQVVPEHNMPLQNPPIPHSQMFNSGNNFFPQACRVSLPHISTIQNQTFSNIVQPMQHVEPLQNMYFPCQTIPDGPQPLSDANVYHYNQEGRPMDVQIQLSSHNNLPVHHRLGIGRQISIAHRMSHHVRNRHGTHMSDTQHQNARQMESHEKVYNSPNKLLIGNGINASWKNNNEETFIKKDFEPNVNCFAQPKAETTLINCIAKEIVDDEDDETKTYRLKIEEQKRKREEILQRKEERRKMAALENKGIEMTVMSTIPRPNKQHYTMARQRKPKSIVANPNITRIVPISNIKIIVPTESSHIAVKATSTLLNDITIDTSSIATNVNRFSVANKQLPETRSVSVKNLSANTKERKLIAMCRGVGDFQKLHLDKQKRQATIEFKSVAAAHSFYKKYQRHMLDLSVIEVFLLPIT